MRKEYIGALVILGISIIGAILFLAVNRPAGRAPVGMAAQEFFETNVSPLLVAKCQACHSGIAAPTAPKFLGEGPHTGFYRSITRSTVVGTYSSSAKIASYGAHEGITWRDTSQLAQVAQWLDLEAGERVGSAENNPIDTPGALQLLAEWSGCMTKANWDAANMGSWANKEAEGEQCASCHQDGLARFYTNSANDTMFTMNHYEAFVIGFFTVDVDPKTARDAIVIDRKKLGRKGNGEGLHPTYSIDDEYFDRLQQFYDLTMATKGANECGPAQFPP